MSRTLPQPMATGTHPSVLAPMQDVTTTGFFQVVAQRGAPDWFVTEYLRVHETSTPEKHIVESIESHGTQRPVFAQLIGEDIPHILRTVRWLIKHLPVAGIDLNLGCPAPKVYRKNVGGGLLRDPTKIDAILGAMRSEIPGLFTVKMRLGFDSQEPLPHVLESVVKHKVDLLTVHGRTVKGLYWSEVDYPAIARAVKGVGCPVIANGDIWSAEKASQIVRETGAWGVMMGRHAIRNPWLFRQWREAQLGQPLYRPTLKEVRTYIDDLAHHCCEASAGDDRRASRLKKFLNFVGTAVDAEGKFLHAMRRTEGMSALMACCDEYLLGERASELYPLEPHPGLIARPTRETQQSCEL